MGREFLSPPQHPAEREQSGRVVELTIHLHLMPKYSMIRAPHVFTVWEIIRVTLY
jgi:hypothetical protein